MGGWGPAHCPRVPHVSERRMGDFGSASPVSLPPPRPTSTLPANPLLPSTSTSVATPLLAASGGLFPGVSPSPSRLMLPPSLLPRHSAHERRVAANPCVWVVPPLPGGGALALLVWSLCGGGLPIWGGGGRRRSVDDGCRRLAADHFSGALWRDATAPLPRHATQRSRKSEDHRRAGVPAKSRGRSAGDARADPSPLLLPALSSPPPPTQPQSSPTPPPSPPLRPPLAPDWGARGAPHVAAPPPPPTGTPPRRASRRSRDPPAGGRGWGRAPAPLGPRHHRPEIGTGGREEAQDRQGPGFGSRQGPASRCGTPPPRHTGRWDGPPRLAGRSKGPPPRQERQQPRRWEGPPPPRDHGQEPRREGPASPREQQLSGRWGGLPPPPERQHPGRWEGPPTSRGQHLSGLWEGSPLLRERQQPGRWEGLPPPYEQQQPGRWERLPPPPRCESPRGGNWGADLSPPRRDRWERGREGQREQNWAAADGQPRWGSGPRPPTLSPPRRDGRQETGQRRGPNQLYADAPAHRGYPPGIGTSTTRRVGTGYSLPRPLQLQPHESGRASSPPSEPKPGSRHPASPRMPSPRESRGRRKRKRSPSPAGGRSRARLSRSRTL